MFRLLRHDIKRVLLSPYIWISVILFVFAGILQQFSSVSVGNLPFNIPKKFIENVGFLNRYLLSVCSPNKETLAFALPIIMMLPCGTLFLSEYKSKYLRNVLTRSSKFNYIVAEIVSAFIMGALTVLASEILLLIFCAIIDPHASEAILDNFGEGGAVSGIYCSSIFGFSLFQSGNLMLFGGAYSVLALGFSALWNNKYLTLGTGFLYANILLPDLNDITGTPLASYCVKPWYLDMFNIPYTSVLLQYACIFAFGAFIFVVCVMRRCASDI